MSRILFGIGCAFVSLGCGAASPQPMSADAIARDADALVQLERLTVVGYTTEELLADFERARSHLLAERFERAAKEFERLSKLAEDPAIAGLALYNAGYAHEGMGDRAGAIVRYQRFVDGHGAHKLASSALVRLTRLLGYLERWPELLRAAGRLLAEDELSALERIEGHGAQALALIAQGKTEQARVALGKAQKRIDEANLVGLSNPPVQLAQVSFATGELRRRQSEAIKLTPVLKDFGQVLELRCQGLLDAQEAYTEAMKSRDAHWSAMSGFRVGQLYQQLHRETMEIPPPAHTTPKQRQLFEAAMRLRYRILLEKGLKMMAGTVRLSERTGERSNWAGRAREAKKALEEALAAEKAALEKLPYSEQEIRAALELLRERPPAALR